MPLISRLRSRSRLRYRRHCFVISPCVQRAELFTTTLTKAMLPSGAITSPYAKLGQEGSVRFAERGRIEHDAQRFYPVIAWRRYTHRPRTWRVRRRLRPGRGLSRAQEGRPRGHYRPEPHHLFSRRRRGHQTCHRRRQTRFVLVDRSYGGVVMSEAGTDQKVSAVESSRSLLLYSLPNEFRLCGPLRSPRNVRD